MPRRHLTLEEALELGAIKPLENSEIYLIRRLNTVDIYFRDTNLPRRLKYECSYPSEMFDEPSDNGKDRRKQ